MIGHRNVLCPGISKRCSSEVQYTASRLERSVLCESLQYHSAASWDGEGETIVTDSVTDGNQVSDLARHDDDVCRSSRRLD